MREISISECEAGQRLDKYLKKYLCEAGSGFIYKMLRKKNIVLNGRKASGSEILAAGDMLKLFLAEGTIDKFSGTVSRNHNIPRITVGKNSATGVVSITCDNYNVPILFEDDNVIFFSKPSGLLSQKSVGSDISLVDIFTEYMRYISKNDYPTNSGYKPGICNRLDRNTSGVVAAGKSVMGLQALSYVIKNREVSKFYRCIVHGKVSKPGYLKGYLVKDSHTNKVRLADVYPADAITDTASASDSANTGEEQYIETSYRPIAGNDSYSMLEVELITGRTHQIRAHLASTGHPIAGDVKYGAPRDNKLKYQLLHAYEMRFGSSMDRYAGILVNVMGKSIVSPLPDIFDRYEGIKHGGEDACHHGIHGA